MIGKSVVKWAIRHYGIGGRFTSCSIFCCCQSVLSKVAVATDRRAAAHSSIHAVPYFQSPAGGYDSSDTLADLHKILSNG